MTPPGLALCVPPLSDSQDWEHRGTHGEDIDLIIDVDPGEAQKLIGLIEILVEDWYVARRKREEHLKEIKQIAGAKEA
jgi:hypothetical protein